MTDGTEPGPSELTAPQVAKLLGTKRRQDVNEIPRDQLPYRETRGGPRRGGRRYYRQEDVDAYLRRGDRIADLEARVAELEAWRERTEHVQE